MALKRLFDQQAEQDLREIREYLVREAGARSANKVRAHLREQMQRLHLFPLIGSPTTD